MIQSLTVFNLADVTHEDVGNGELFELALSNDGELVVRFNLVLEASKLSLLGPVVEGDDQDDYYDSHQNGCTFYPSSFAFRLIVACGIDI